MKRLHAWLCDNISPTDFVRLVEHGDGFGISGRRLGSSLPPENLSCAEFFYRSLRLLEQHGLLREAAFFDYLAEARPLRAKEVQEFMRELCTRRLPTSNRGSRTRSSVLVWKAMVAGLTLL